MQEFRFISGPYADTEKVWVVQGTESRKVLMYRRISLGCAEFARCDWADLVPA